MAEYLINTMKQHIDLKRVIIDTDAKNEIDDQYAIAYAVLSGAFDIRGFTAAHFGREGSMEASYNEIIHMLKLLGRNSDYHIFRGANHALKDRHSPIDNEGSRFIIDEAMSSSDDPLYIICIGAITNLASAYLLRPEINSRIKVIWLAGRAWPKGGLFFNNRMDIMAAQTVFSSDIDLTLIPSCGTANKIKIYPWDRRHIKGRGRTGDYLWKLFIRRRWGLPKPVYDLTPIAGLKSPELITWINAPRPALSTDGTYDHSNTNGQIRVAVDLESKLIRKDFFSTLRSAF